MSEDSGKRHLYIPQFIREEPWVRLGTGEDLADWEHTDSVAANQINRQIEKYRFFVKAFDFLKENQIEGDYHEFGCHQVRTFRMALTEARRHNLNDMWFYAYDSFEGLPENKSNPNHDLFNQQGALSTSEEQFMDIVQSHGIYVDNIKTIKGYYNNSLTPGLQTKIDKTGRKIVLACVDCDLYESAVDVFGYIEPLLQEGSLIYIDDLFIGYRGSPSKGVAKAFLDFQNRSRFHFVRHLDVGWWGRSYIVCLEPPPSGVL